MAEESNVPAQPEGAGQKAKVRPQPVNLAVIEAAQRGLDFDPPKPPPKPAAVVPPPVVPEPEPAYVARDVAAPAEPPPLPEASGGSNEDLASLAEAATRGRLSQHDEDRATALMRASLTAGGEGVPAALAALPKLPWILGVRAIEQAWPALDAEARTALLAGLAELGGDHAVRLRLSVARSLAKIEPPVGVQLAGAVCRTMWDTEKGGLSAEHSKLIGNVFIGRGKPWVLQLSLEGLPDEDADAIASCVIFSAFNVNNPPITQLSVLRYAGSRLPRLHENLLALVARGISRWSGKWQSALRKEIADLPEALTSALKPDREERGTPQAARTSSRRTEENGEAAAAAKVDEEGEIPLPPQLEEKLKLAVESGDHEAIEAVTQEVNTWRETQRTIHEAEAEGTAEDEDSEQRETRSGRRGRRGRERERKERPAYVSREQEAAKSVTNFNLSTVLRQVENYVQHLRNELGAMQTRLRKTETGPRRTSDRVVLSVEESNLSPEELKRLVVQLEQRNAELQTRVEELLADSEARALATDADNEVTGQFRALLKIKLQEDYTDYCALETNSPDLVVEQHYRGLIRSVFAVLRNEGIALEGELPPPPPPPPEPLPPPPPAPVMEDDEADESDSGDWAEDEEAETETEPPTDEEPPAEPEETK